MRAMRVAVAVVLLIGGGAALFVYRGIYDVAASKPHSPLVEWVLSTAMERSVRARAGAIRPPPLDQPERVKRGARSYAEMCAGCHAAPGVQRSSVGRGLMPEPPELAREAAAWSPGEAFWITKHGIRMTGMPAFGATHTEEEIWDLVAFVERLPGFSEREYAELTEGSRRPREHVHDE